MKKTLFMALLLILAVGSSAYAVEFTGTLDDAKAKAAELNKPLLVDVFTTW